MRVLPLYIHEGACVHASMCECDWVCAWVHLMCEHALQLKKFLLNFKSWKFRTTQEKSIYFYSLNCAVSYLQRVYLIQFSIEVASVAAYTKAGGNAFFSQFQNTKIELKNTKLESFFRQKCRVVCYHSYRCIISSLQLIYLTWFSLEIDVALSQAMSRKFKVKSTKNKLKYAKLENYFWQKCRSISVYSLKCTISYLQLFYLMWFPLEVAPIEALSEAMSKISQVRKMHQNLQKLNIFWKLL